MTIWAYGAHPYSIVIRPAISGMDFALNEERLLPFDLPERFMPTGLNSEFPELTIGVVWDLHKKNNNPMTVNWHKLLLE